MLHLALSCLQGRPMQSAAESLWALGPDGLQLTPGNAPTRGFAAWLAAREVGYGAHHGFCFDALRTPVWAEDGRCLVPGRSVHPPKSTHPAADGFVRRAEAGAFEDVTLETMYPGYLLGCGAQLGWAMELGLRLAVDVSHLFMQRAAGVLDEPTWRRLQDYDRVDEVHVSHNDGRRDQHRAVSADTWGLSWARARAAAGAVLVLECYMHRMSEDESRRQVDLLRGDSQ